MRYNPVQRKEFQDTIQTEYKYIRAVLMERQDGACAVCGDRDVPFDIDHKLYNPMMTVNELQLLCVPCHKDKTNFTPMRNRKPLATCG